MPSDLFDHLKTRCRQLGRRFLDPAIKAEALAVQEERPLPDPDFDDFAAFRLLAHAELEEYFEKKAFAALERLDAKFKEGKVLTADFASLMFLLVWKEKRRPIWPENAGEDQASREKDDNFIKALAQEALGFGRQFIRENNGIKEGSIQILSALMGYFPHELNTTLVSELNQYGRKRGDVAHHSWTFNTRTFDSAEIERTRIENILELTKTFYEN